MNRSIRNTASPGPLQEIAAGGTGARYLIPLLVLMLALLSGCASMATDRMANNLASAMLNQDDPDTVRAGAPAYLLLLDGMIRDNPKDISLLIAGSRLYGALASGLIKDPGRIKRMSNRSLEYARRALCLREVALCRSESAPYAKFVSSADRADWSDPKLIYTYAISWAGWIAARSGDWNALANLPKVEYLLQRIIQKAPAYDNGRAQLYLAVMRSQLPPALGGKPEEGRRHFELAIRYSKGRDLIAKVEYARHYARLVFNKALHDRLLHEVLAAPAVAPDLTLSNILAKQQARMLLKEDYF